MIPDTVHTNLINILITCKYCSHTYARSYK